MNNYVLFSLEVCILGQLASTVFISVGLLLNPGASEVVSIFMQSCGDVDEPCTDQIFWL